MGEYGLTPGKQTAFDTDVNVPLIAAGPGIGPHHGDRTGREHRSAAHFNELAGTQHPGRRRRQQPGAAPARRPPPAWRRPGADRTSRPAHRPGRPGPSSRGNGNPPDYHALRSPAFTYVEYGDGTREYYDNTADPHQLHNVAHTLSPERLAWLRATLGRLSGCRGQPACQEAG